MYKVGKFYRYGLGFLLFILGFTYPGSVPPEESAPAHIVIDYCATLRGYLEPCG